MAENSRAPLRSWQEIAEEASKERDPEKLLKLTHELEDALGKRDEELSKRKGAESVPDSSTDLGRRSSRSKGA